MKQQMRLEDALPLMEASFEAGVPFRFFSRGTSMLPMLREGIDSVSLVSGAVREPKKGEVILYRRKNGAFVLHRLMSIDKDGSFVCCGDNQFLLEKGIDPRSVLAVLEGFYRGEDWVSADDKEYRKYVKKRMRSRRFRALRSYIRSILK